MIGCRRLAAASACLAVLCLAGCAGIAAAPGPFVDVSVGKRDAVYISSPVVPDSVDALLARIGWGEGRMSRELRKELAYQFNRKGVATVEDSAQAKVILAVYLSEYVQGEGTVSHFSVDGVLKTPAGERRIEFKKDPRGAGSLEREDPTLDNIRQIADAMVEGSRKDPKIKRDPSDYNPGLMMVF